MKKNLLLLLCTLALCINADARRWQSNAQITFAYPLGSNGYHSIDMSNNFSFNVIYGLNGGVEGFELGGLMNYNEGYVNGLQIAGLLNLNTEYSNGLLISGLMNYVHEESTGLQISNININNGDMHGAQVGFLNYGRDFNGSQIGVFNVSHDFYGLQIGVINIAQKVKGVQIGVMNIASDGRKALPIGLLNFIKRGFYELEFTANEVMYSNMAIKMGVEQLYTIYKFGASTFEGDFIASYGLGFGSKIHLGRKNDLNIEATASQIMYDIDWGSELNLLNRMDVNYVFNVNRNLSLLVGASYNVYVSKIMVDGEFGTLNIPYTISEENKTNSGIKTWIGGNIGISFRL